MNPVTQKTSPIFQFFISTSRHLFFTLNLTLFYSDLHFSKTLDKLLNKLLASIGNKRNEVFFAIITIYRLPDHQPTLAFGIKACAPCLKIQIEESYQKFLKSIDKFFVGCLCNYYCPSDFGLFKYYICQGGHLY